MLAVLNALFAGLTLLVAALWAWPLARALLPPATAEDEFTAVLVGLGLSLGGLSLALLCLGLLPGSWLVRPLVLLLPYLGLALSARVGLTRAPVDRAALWRTARTLLADPVRLLLVLLVLGGLTVIAVNCLSYPFYRYDTLTRFAPNARQLYTLGHIPADLHGYPIGVQLLYAFGFFAANGVVDPAAHWFGFLLSAGGILITYPLLREWFGPRVGWAGLLLAFTSPFVIDWATAAYVDLPEGFYHGLTFLFALRWLRHGDIKSALLAGLFAGLALWVKQSSLPLIPALGLIVVLRVAALTITARKRPTLATLWRESALGLGVLAVLLAIAAPWYLRTYLLDQPVLPAPGSFDELFVDRSLSALLTFWGRRSEWGWPVSLLGSGGLLLFLAAFGIPRRVLPSATPLDTRLALLLWLGFVLPYHLLWWWQFTYQTRYLLANLALYLAPAALALDWLLAQFEARWATRPPALKWAVPVLAALFIFFGVFNRLGAVYYLVTDPLQTTETKLTRLAGESWQVTRYVYDHYPPGTPVYATDGNLTYWLADYAFQQGYPATLAALGPARVFIYNLRVAPVVYAGTGQADNEIEALTSASPPSSATLREVFRADDLVVFEVSPP